VVLWVGGADHLSPAEVTATVAIGMSMAVGGASYGRAALVWAQDGRVFLLDGLHERSLAAESVLAVARVGIHGARMYWLRVQLGEHATKEVFVNLGGLRAARSW
jgi:hypothetical protein